MVVHGGQLIPIHMSITHWNNPNSFLELSPQKKYRFRKWKISWEKKTTSRPTNPGIRKQSVIPHSNSKGRKRSQERRLPSHTAWENIGVLAVEAGASSRKLLDWYC